MKILAPKFGSLSYRYSQALRLDWFNGATLQKFVDVPEAFVVNFPPLCHQLRWFPNRHRCRNLHATKCQHLALRSHHEIQVFLHGKNSGAVGGAPSRIVKTICFPILQQTCFFLLLQLGIQAEGIKELFRSAAPESFSFTDFQAIFNMVSTHRSYKR